MYIILDTEEVKGLTPGAGGQGSRGQQAGGIADRLVQGFCPLVQPAFILTLELEIKQILLGIGYNIHYILNLCHFLIVNYMHRHTDTYTQTHRHTHKDIHIHV